MSYCLVEKVLVATTCWYCHEGLDMMIALARPAPDEQVARYTKQQGISCTNECDACGIWCVVGEELINY